MQLAHGGLPHARQDLDHRAELLRISGPSDAAEAEAIAKVQPWGVDVSSGVEREPGRKDPRRVRAFVANAKAAEPAGYVSAYDEPYDWQLDD